MSTDALRFEAVTLRRMPGFPRGGFELRGLSPGVNIVYGPNASGKTTTATALNELLWPGVTRRTNVSVIGRYQVGDADWHVDLEAGRARHQRNGNDAAPPTLPAAEARDRYNLALHDLLRERDVGLAEAVARELAGGYDVTAAAETLGFKIRPSSPRAATRDVEQAQQTLREARREQEALQEDEAQLESLRARLLTAQHARERVRLVQLAMDSAQAQQAADEAAEALASFPRQLAMLAGDEAATVRKLRERRDEFERARAAAEAQVRDSEAEIKACDLPTGPVSDQLVRTLRARLEDLREHELQQDRLAAELAGAGTARDRERRALGNAVTDEQLAALDAVAFDELAQFAQQAERLHAARAACDEMERWLGTPPRADRDDLETLRTGRQLLQSWLRASSTRPGAIRGGARVVLLVTAAVIVLAAIVTMFALHWSAAMLLLPAVAIGGVLVWRPRVTDAALKQYREDYTELGLESPPSWNEAGIQERIRAIDREFAGAQVEHERLQRWQDLDERRAKLLRDEQTLAEQRAALAARLGVAPDADERKLYWLANTVSRWQNEQQRVVALEQQVAAVDAQCSELRATINAELTPFGYDTAADRSAAVGAVDDLDRRRQRYADAARGRQVAQREVARLKDEIERVSTESDALMTRLELAEDDLATLTTWCAQLDEYRTAVKRHDAAQGAAAHAARQLEQHPDHDARLVQLTPDALAAERAEASAAAEQADALQREITTIETRIADAKAGHRIAEALAALDTARDALRVERDESEAAVVGAALADFIQEQTRQQQRPAVLGRASALLERITRGAFRLEVDLAGDDGPAFRAIDTVEGIGRSLDELSSGTRVQLLLAVRVAFVEQQEAGVRLPLLLDEVLANSDDERAAAIIDAMLTIAAEGRQVFYFTAQPDEVGKWLGRMDERGDVAHATFDLAEIRSLETPTEITIARPTRATVPAPQGQDYDEYARTIGVPRIDPYGDVGAVHVWYVLDDVDLLHRMLELGITQWGPLRTLLSEKAVPGVEDVDDVRARAEAAAQVIEQLCEDWRAGHGRPLDRAALIASAAVSDVYLEKVAALSEALEGDAQRVLAALRDGQVKGFRKSAIAKLEEYCEEVGHTPTGPTRSGEDMKLRAIAAGRSALDAGWLTEHDIERILAGLGAVESATGVHVEGTHA